MAPTNTTTSASLVFKNLQKFIILWKSGKEGSFKVDCKDGQAKLILEEKIFSCNLGNPDDHIQDGRRGKSRVKSENRKARDNARAAAFQAARAPPTAPTPADQDVPLPVPPALPPAGQDREKSPPQSHQLTTPSPSQQPPPRHTSPLPSPHTLFFLTSKTSSLPSSPGETSQEKEAESVKTRSGTRSVRFSEEAGEKETLELPPAPRGTENATEEEVASPQHSPSSHQGREAVERKEDDQGKDGLPPPSFLQHSLDLEEERQAAIRALNLQEERLAAIRARRSTASSPESVKPDQPPDEDHPPPLKRN